VRKPPIFEIVTTSAGAVSIRNIVVDEIMHNPVGPWAEANDLYIRQSRLRARLTADAQAPLVLFDVGLGAASNAIAACHARKLIGHEARQLQIISFENDLELLRFTIDHAHHFPHLNGYVDALESLLQHHHWTSPDGFVDWQLRPGDFMQTIDHEPTRAELIFFDPYSPAVNQDMWSLETFTKLIQKCQPQAIGYTYSVATPIRVAMMLAGFYAGQGSPTGLKRETTQFALAAEALDQPFGLEWFGRWVRSHHQLPFGTSSEQAADLKTRFCAHPQVSPWVSQSAALLKKAFPGRP
jgi:tRNA U34 5-methylaminomethyl-2-thiouridine-forming methyltransferase MnmC